MKVLYIGGTGEISHACVAEALRAGHQVTVFNRGLREQVLPAGVKSIVGDFSDDATYRSLASHQFDVVCQFLAFTPEHVQRDIDVFQASCAQYIFISTASAYEKPAFRGGPGSHIIDEDTPLFNPHWAYSRSKAACEARLLDAHAAGSLPVTIVRPSHTYRSRFPSAIIDGNHFAWRVLQNKPVLVHGDGESLWALTHASDFARAFVALCGLENSLGECVHITSSESHTWNNILKTIFKTLDRAPNVVPVLSRTLIDYEPTWEGTLLGDKSNSVVFNNSKIKRLCGEWQCQVSLEAGFNSTWRHVEKRLQAGFEPDPKTDALIDHIIEAQTIKQA